MYIINQSLTTGIFPNDWKVARVTPLYKDDIKTNPDNPVMDSLSKVWHVAFIKKLFRLFSKCGPAQLTNIASEIMEQTVLFTVLKGSALREVQEEHHRRDHKKGSQNSIYLLWSRPIDMIVSNY